MLRALSLQEAERLVANKELTSKAKVQATIHKGSPVSLHKVFWSQKGPTGHQGQRSLSSSGQVSITAEEHPVDSS